MTEPSLETTLRIPAGVLFRALDNEAVLLDSESGFYFTLNESGTVVWQSLSEDGRLRSALKALTDAFETDTERLTADLLSLVQQLLEHRLVEVNDR